MAPSACSPHDLKMAVTVVLIICSLTFLPSKSVGSLFSSQSVSFQQRKMVLGSRPPACVNKCLSCKPCMATLVVPPHQRKGLGKSSHGGDDSYYLLSWKCRCGDKLFQP